MEETIATDFSDPNVLLAEWWEWCTTYDTSDFKVGEDFNKVINTALATRQIVEGRSVDTIDEALTEVLVGRWYQWWYESNQVPDKLPNVLHVRTALFLYHKGLLDLATLNVKTS